MNINVSEDTFLNRSVPLLTSAGIERLSTSKVAVAGCGGIGGSMALALCRMGVGQFQLADPADFDPPDMNRQWGATGQTLGCNKAEVYRDMILDINPDAKVQTFTDGLTMTNQQAFLGDADILVDCLDVAVPYELRETMHALARDANMFSVVAPILGFGCFAICSSPTGMGMACWTEMVKNARTTSTMPAVFYDLFVPEQMDVIATSLQVGRVPTVSVGPMIGSALLATECVTYLLQDIIPGARAPIVLPKVMAFDLLKMSYQVIDIEDVQRRGG